MARDKGLLSDLQLRRWIKAGTPLARADSNGLTFTLSAAGVAGWILRYRHGGRRRELTIGRYPDISLADARGIATIKRAELDLLATQPLMGRVRDELLVGLRSFPFGRYVIFYMVVEDGVDVVRVLHSRRDLDAHTIEPN